MPTVDTLYRFLSGKFPEELRLEWDNDGLMVASDPDREVFRVLCTLDVTDEAIDYAIAGNFDTIVSHHPLLFKPLKSASYSDPVGRKVIKLLKHNISVMSFHTRLDAAHGGMNDILAGLLGLKEVEPLQWEGEKIGRVGVLENALGCTEFASFVKKTLKCERVLYSTAESFVHRVAVCGGDGKSYVEAAKTAGADTYLTGQLSYNIMEDSDLIGLNLYEAGHFHSEDFICSYLTLLILKEFTQIQTSYFNSNRIKAV